MKGSRFNEGPSFSLPDVLRRITKTEEEEGKVFPTSENPFERKFRKKQFRGETQPALLLRS